MVAKRLQYRYDAVGNKVGMTDADGGLFTYTYDVMRRLTGVINPLGERTTYVYDLNGRRTSAQLANGTRTSYSYDQGSRVQQVHTLKSNNNTVAKFDYAYDDNGRRTSVLEADGSRVTWTYDGTSQVTSEWRTGTSPFRHTFVYDTRGNRTLKIEDGSRTSLVYDAANQLSSSEDAGGTTNYTYDANGNQHVTVAPGGSRTTQIWDYENRLVKTLQPGGGVSTMAYDADGLRIRKETPSEAKLFVWDDQNYLAEADDSGVTEVAYTTEPSTYGSTISHRSGGATTTYHFDALAAARVLTNASETVLESYNYTAFGTILDSPSLLTPFLWGGLVGYYWDADLGSQYIRARHYQPNIARWISLDPIGFVGGDSNLFRYVGNSSTSGATGMRVSLTMSFTLDSYSSLVVSGLRYFIRAILEGNLLGKNSIINPNVYRPYLGWFSAKCLDPSGLVVIKDKLDCSMKTCVFTMQNHYPEQESGAIPDDVYRTEAEKRWGLIGDQIKSLCGPNGSVAIIPLVGKPREVCDAVMNHKCCQLVMVGHAGGRPGGIVTYPGLHRPDTDDDPGDRLYILPNPATEGCIVTEMAANGCKPKAPGCKIFITACNRPDRDFDAGRKAIAKATGCRVCGTRTFICNGCPNKKGQYFEGPVGTIYPHDFDPATDTPDFDFTCQDP